MKKYFKIGLFLSLLSLISSCSSSQEDNNNEKYKESVGFTFHYYRRDSNYSSYNMWIWENNKDGKDYNFQGVDSYGAYLSFSWDDFTSDIKSNGINFIVKEAKTWAEGASKDVEEDRKVDFSKFNFSKEDGLYHIYLKSGDSNIYGVNEEIGDEITSSYLYQDYSTKDIRAKIKTNNEFKKIEIKKNNETIYSSLDTSDTNVIKNNNLEFEYNFKDQLPDFSSTYFVSVTFKDSNKTLLSLLDFTKLYKSTLFEEKYTYNDELGAIYSKESTTFKVWSPVSSSIELRIYNSGTPSKITDSNGNLITLKNGDDSYTSYKMNKDESNGVFSYKIDGDLEGKYYTYVVSNYLYKDKEIVDPYSKSSGINGLRGMIVDFSKTNPEGWENIKINEYSPSNLTVYETHIADLTSSSTWNGATSNSKTYNGFYEAGTSYSLNSNTVKTGFDHIKELGVNTVQLLPIFDQANDERIESRSFNWGYNPLNYNVLDGIYSSNPYDGYTKIKEFKNLVKAYNEAGINIIMDVVYNHVNSLDSSSFNILMPYYYFRYNNSKASNGSGCGNETASEMPMFKKFIIDSTYFWASEYKLAGFRFDLMGLHDLDTMNEVAAKLHSLNNYITIYGEPWTGGTTSLQSNVQAIQSNITKFNGFGCFNDKMRDSLIKGGLNAKTDKGWISETNKSSSILNIENGIKGFQDSYFKVESYKTVNYVTCHDNYTLYDRFKACGINDEETIKKMAVLANSIVFSSQGISFMLSGEEFLRTKNGNSNSYNASYKINELDYSLKIKNLDVFNNYKSIIKLKQNKGLFNKSLDDSKNTVINKSSDESLFYYDLIDDINNISYRFIFSNGYNKNNKSVDLEGYSLYLDTLNKDNLILSKNTSIDEFQTIIAYKKL